MTTLLSLEPALRVRIGDNVAGAYQWNTDELVDVLDNSLKRYNAEQPFQEFSVTGSGDDRVYYPTPAGNDTELLLLYAELYVAESEKHRAIRASVVRSTPVGNINLTDIRRGWVEEVKDLKKRIAEFKNAVGHVDMMPRIVARELSQN